MNVGTGSILFQWHLLFQVLVPGGKQAIMKDGFFLNAQGERVCQPMVFTEGSFKGQAKGLRQVCIERFGPDSVKGKKQDDLGKLIWSEPSLCTAPWALLKVSTFEKIAQNFLFQYYQFVNLSVSVRMLESEEDFRDQKPLIVEAVEAAGGKVLFGTKFHPELMPIENAYRY